MSRLRRRPLASHFDCSVGLLRGHRLCHTLLLPRWHASEAKGILLHRQQRCGVRIVKERKGSQALCRVTKGGKGIGRTVSEPGLTASL